MRALAKRLLSDQSGAIAAVYALALPALIAVGGIAFDYARLAAMDTELQNAADQAALAAASQLDGLPGTCSRASGAAVNLVTNSTLFANDGVTPGVTVTGETACDALGKIRFWQNKEKTVAATSDGNANFVEVTVNARTAKYALTPVVGAFNSGAIDATAFAGLGSAICRVPPLMMCNPAEVGGNLDFDIATYKGMGMRLVSGGGSQWAPGNFGYLQTDIGNGAGALELALGANSPPGNCLSADKVTTKPGVQTSVTDAINTRFDIFENGLVNECAIGTGACSPAMNTRKDAVHPEITSGNGNGNGNGNNALNCGFDTGSDPWTLPTVRYLPDLTTRTQPTLPTNMGHPRDICHAVSNDGDCRGTASRIGDGAWDRTMYFQVNHPSIGANWQNNNSLTTWATANGVTLNSISRYDTYRWEIATNNLADRLAYNVTTGGGGGGKGGGPGGGNTTGYYSYAAPKCTAGLPSSNTQLDRRLTAVAIVNCGQEGLNGQEKGVTVVNWVEVFLVEPSIARDRTAAGDIYVEIVRQIDVGDGIGGGGQVARRDVPYLIE